MNNNSYTTSLSDAYMKLAQARAIRDASVNNQQIDSSGVVLNTTPQSNNNVQAQEEQQVPQTTTTTYDASIGERVLGTVYEAIDNIKYGLLNTVEGVADYAISGIGGLINEEWAEEAVKFDVTDTLLEWSDDNFSLNALYKSATGQNLYDQSYLYEADEKIRDIVIGVEQGIGNAIAFLGLSAIPYVGLPLVGMGAGGMAVEEALIDENYSGNYWGAFAYGTASGIVETAIEYLSMGTGKLLSKFGLDNAMGAFAGKLTKNTTSREALTTIIGSFASEGLEEVASDLVNPLLSSLYNGKSVEENWESDVTAEGLGTTFLVGGLTGALMQGAGEVANTMYLSPEGKAISSEINANTDKYAEAYKAFKEATQTADITTQQNALKEFNKVRDEVVASMEALGTRIKNLASEYQYRLGTTTVIDGKKVKLPLTSEVISGQAETMKNFSPVEQAVVEVLDVVNKQRNNNGLENLEVEFSSDVDYNGMISGNKLVLSTNPQKAIRQVLSHEITHSFENNSEYQGVYDEIINTLKKNGEYEQAYKDMEALYKKNNVSYDNELLNKELVAEYVANNLFSSYADMSKAFSKQSTLNKFVDMLKGLRKKSSSSKAKDLYLKMIQKGMSSKVNETNEKYSLNKKSKNEVAFAYQLDTLAKKNITFVDSYSDVLQALKTVSSFRGEMDAHYKKNIKTLANELINSMRINGLTLDKYFEMDAKSEDYRDFIKNLKSQAVTYIMSETYDLLKQEKQVVVDNMIKALVTRIYDTIDTYKKLNARGRKVTAKISSLQYWFKNAVAQGKKYSKEKLESLLENVAKKISGIKFTSITTRTQAGARNVVVELQGETFFKNEKVEPFLNKDEGVRMYIDEAIKYIVERAKTEGVKPLDTDTVINDSNYELLAGKTEAEVVADILSEVRRIVNASNEKVGYLDGELVNVKEKAQEEATEQRKIDRKTPAHKVLGYPNQYFLSLVDIRTYMVVMAHSNNNSLMMKLYDQLEQGQRKTFEIRTKLLKDLTQYLKDNSKSIRKLKSKKDSITFGGVKMTIGEAISLYMMSNTDYAWSHFVKDGVKFRTEVEGKPRDITGDVFLSYLSEEEQNLLKDKSFLKSRKGSNLEKKNELYLKAIESARNELKSLIGTEYDGLIKTIEDIYSNSKSGKYYEEASKKILGYSFGLKKYYYPTRSATLDLKEETELVSHIQTQFNPSFTKQVVKGASNDLFVSDVVDTALAFVKNLSTFAGVTVEINNAKRFLNAEVRVSGLNKEISLYKYFNDMVDTRFKDRIDALFQAMQGLKTKIDTPLDKATKWARAMGAKMALGANLKTMVTQLTSYIRGSMYISNANLVRALGNPKSFGLLDFSVAEEESPIIANRYFDNNVLNIESINAFNQVDKMTELFMKPIEVFDKIPIKRLWYACQLQTMENGKVNKEKALELYERVVRDTQAQYDALGNGSITRVENEFVKSLLMYTSESRKMFSRFYEAIYRVATSPKGSTEYNQAKKLLASAGTNIIANAVIVTMISVIFKQLKGDYDDKEKEEILADIIKQDFASQIIGMFPIFSNIYNTLANGYEWQLGGLSQVTQLMDVFTTHLAVLSNPNSSKGEMRSALIQIVQKIGHFFGIPVRNLFNDTLYIAGLGDLFLDTDMVLKMKNFWYNTNNSSLSTLLSTYKSKGNVDKVEAVIEMKFKNYGAGDLGKEDVSEISRLYMSGALKSLPKQLGETMTYNNETITLSKQQTKIAKDVYSIANDLLSKMIRSSAYSSLSDEEKALAIRRLYDTYYELAKGSVIKEYELNKLASVADYIDMSKYAVYLAKIASMTESKTQTRKVVVQSYINSLRLNKNEKYLLNYLAGYKLSEENQAFVVNYLRSQGMAYTEARNYFA